MDFSALQNFEFAAPLWLWGLSLLPFLWAAYALYYRSGPGGGRIEDFADPHLLPHILDGGPAAAKRRSRKRVWPPLLLWSLFWAFGLLAMAGPRWDYTEVKAFEPARNLVILLDMSKSMDAGDLKPSRLARARQEIQDILRLADGVNIGLIAFDEVPHVITPLTDDKETLTRLLPSLHTGLVYTQGSNLSAALDAAGRMLSYEPGNEKHVLVISDGGFDDGDAPIFKAERALTDAGAHVHVMGAGTAEGAPIPDGKNGFAKDSKGVVITRLDQKRLRRVAQDGKGLYLAMSYLENDTRALLGHIEKAAANTKSEKTTRSWEERFYIFLLPLALLLLPWFRRNAAFPALLALLMVQAHPAAAANWRDLFLNKAQQGQQAVEAQHYDEAAGKFDDPYRRGVAQYKAGKYDEAQQSFAAANRPAVRTDARYNLGNAQLMGGKIKDAIATYEDLLKDHPDHEDAQHNLEIAKKMLEQQQQNNKQDQKQDSHQNKNDQSQNQSGSDKDQQGKDRQQKDQKDQKGGQDQKDQPQDARDQDGGAQQDSAADQKKNEGKDQPDKAGPQPQDDEQKAKSDEQKSDNGQQDEAKQDETKPDQSKQDAGAQDKADQGEPPQEQQQQAQGGKPPALPDQEKSDLKGQPVRARTQQDIDADQWLSRIQNDPEIFLKNKFYIESQRQGAKQGEHQW